MSRDVKHNLKSDEVVLWNMFGRGRLFTWPLGAYKFIGMHPKRAFYILGKWSDKGIFEWGVNRFLGWKAEYYDVQIGMENLPLLDTERFLVGGAYPVRRPID